MEPTERNRRIWDEVHRRREASPATLPDHVRVRLPDLTGRHVLHLESATGEASADLAVLGALVTGVDRSGEAVARAHDAAPSAAFVHADPQELPLELRRSRFDLVYAAEGTISALADLDAWAQGVASALRNGGSLLLVDTHPLSLCVDALGHLRWDYLASPWPVGAVVTAIVRAGLTIRSVEELPEAPPLRQARIPGTLVVIAQK